MTDNKQGKPEKKLDWVWAYGHSPPKEKKEPINFTDEETIEGWKRVQRERYKL